MDTKIWYEYGEHPVKDCNILVDLSMLKNQDIINKLYDEKLCNYIDYNTYLEWITNTNKYLIIPTYKGSVIDNVKYTDILTEEHFLFF